MYENIQRIQNICEDFIKYHGSVPEGSVAAVDWDAAGIFCYAVIVYVALSVC